ncbi:peptidase inhibitor family I36 protein [Streptomyces chryseus]
MQFSRKVITAALAGIALIGGVSPAVGVERGHSAQSETNASDPSWPTGLILAEHQRLAGKHFYATYTLSELWNFNDKASSVWNNTTDKYYILYDGKYHLGGNNYCIPPGEYVPDLHYPYGFGDKISSVRRMQAWETAMGCQGYRTFNVEHVNSGA